MPEMRQLGYTWINLESLKNVVGMYAKWDHTSYNLAVITSLGSGPVADEIVFKVYLDEDAEIVKFIEARARASKMITEIKMLGHIWINMDALKKAISMYAKDDGSMDESYDLAVITSLKPNPADTKFESSLLFNGFGPSEIVLEASILETEVDGFIEEWAIYMRKQTSTVIAASATDETIVEKVNCLWYAPGMPGYLKAAKDFQENQTPGDHARSE